MVRGLPARRDTLRGRAGHAYVTGGFVKYISMHAAGRELGTNGTVVLNSVLELGLPIRIKQTVRGDVRQITLEDFEKVRPYVEAWLNRPRLSGRPSRRKLQRATRWQQ